MQRRTDKLKRSKELGRPRDHIATGRWPTGTLDAGAPPEAHLVQEIARTFKEKRDDHNHYDLYALATRLKMSRNTLKSLLDGETWPSAITVARLEICYGVNFWNNKHKEASKVTKS